MENLSNEEINALADMQLKSLEVSKSPVSPFDVAIKSYVDSRYSEAVQESKTALSALVDGAPEQLNTLKEISTALGDNANLSGVLVSSIASVQSAVTAEAATRASAITSEVSDRNTAIAVETAARVASEQNIVASISAETEARVLDIGTLAQHKFDVSPFYSGGSEAPFKITESSYLYIGDLWRLRANNIVGGPKRLEFQYSPDGLEENFKTAVPFIRA